MKKIKKYSLVVGLVLTANLIATSNSHASLKVTASPTKNLPQKGAVVKFKFSTMPKTHGVYVVECMAPKTANAIPTVCDTNQAASAWASNLKSDISQGASNAAMEVLVKPEPYWSKGDCVHAKCVFLVLSDHNATTDNSVDTVISFTFASK